MSAIGFEACEQELQTTGYLDKEAFTSLWLRAGRIYGPALLYEAVADCKIDNATVTALIGDVWSNAEYPDRELDTDEWRWLFDLAGYTLDGVANQRPAAKVQLYRGSVPERRADWSWTDNVAVAEKFAAGVRGRKIGTVWTCAAPPEALLCRNSGRNEDEYVVDTHGLIIEVYSPSGTVE